MIETIYKGSKKTNIVIRIIVCISLLVLLIFATVFIIAIANGLPLFLKNAVVMVSLFICTFLFIKIIIYFTKQKPLTIEEIKKLANNIGKEYARKTYSFSKGKYNINPNFKSMIESSGAWYSIHEKIAYVPSMVAALLSGKHHEWIVVAIEKDGFVNHLWCNKGANSTEVELNISISSIIDKCKTDYGYAILIFHNHPNPDPKHITTLLPSKADKESAIQYANIVNKHGINFLDFVCAGGKYVEYYRSISSSFEIKDNTTSDIVDSIDICPKLDYQWQKKLIRSKLRILGKKHLIMKCVAAILAVAVIVSILQNDSDIYASKQTNIESETQRQQKVEETLLAEETSVQEEPEFLFPNSDSEYLTDEDVEGLTSEELQLGINEIYARAGRQFGGENGEYFRSKSWYNPKYSKEEFAKNEGSLLNEFETYNINFLVKKQNRKTNKSETTVPQPLPDVITVIDADNYLQEGIQFCTHCGGAVTNPTNVCPYCGQLLQ